jgi:hypothetical protein
LEPAYVSYPFRFSTYVCSSKFATELLLRPFSAMDVLSGVILTLAVLKLWMLLTMLSLHEYLRRNEARMMVELVVRLVWKAPS